LAAIAMKDIKGLRFGKLVAVEYKGKDAHQNAMWSCRCDCGNETIVRASNLISGKIFSCGCVAKQNALKHGGSKTRLYNIWYGIIRRTEDYTRRDYKDYGGRGIRMCKEWRADFAVFRDWALASGYEDGLSIDRIDPDGNYCPENCRWSTRSTQENNKRHNVVITAHGKTLTAAEWERETGIPAYQIRKRIRLGWSEEKAVTEPISKKHQRLKDEESTVD